MAINFNIFLRTDVIKKVHRYQFYQPDPCRNSFLNVKIEV